MQAKGQDVRALIELGRFPGIVLGIRKERAAAYKSPADLKGMKIGVSAPGSSTNFFVMYLMAKAGLKPADASYIGVGIGPSVIAAITKGEIDAISNLDPMMTKLDLDGAIKVVADTRTEEGTRAIFGGSNPAAVLYAKQDFIARNPNTAQALVNAFYKTLKWLEQRDARAGRRDRAGGILARRQGALYRRRQGQQVGLFVDRRHPGGRHEVGERHAGGVRRRAQGRQGRSREDFRRPVRQEGGRAVSRRWSGQRDACLVAVACMAALWTHPLQAEPNTEENCEDRKSTADIVECLATQTADGSAGSIPPTRS